MNKLKENNFTNSLSFEKNLLQLVADYVSHKNIKHLSIALCKLM